MPSSLTRTSPNNVYGHLPGASGSLADERLLAVDESPYKGQPIAAVAAVDEGNRPRGGRLIEIEYRRASGFFRHPQGDGSRLPNIHHGGR